MSQSQHARLVTRQGQTLALRGLTLSGDLRGVMFAATVEQQFHNPTATSVELVYTFPLPWEAVLLGVEVLLGQQQLGGRVVTKQVAQARYEEALSEGHTAILLEKNHDHSYTLNLGNLAPNESCTITLRYAQTLRFEQHGLRLLIPTVIAPRYGDPQRQGGLLPHQVPRHSWQADYAFDVNLRLCGVVAQSRVASPSHPIRMQLASDARTSEAMLTVSLARQAFLDRDFVLVLDELAHDSVAIAAPDGVAPNSLAVLASFCPRLHHTHPPHIAVKLLVDCSGSMAGDSMQAAQRALHAIVKQLGVEDRFSMSRFGSTVEHRSRGLWKATEATQQAARRWVDALAADMGGTEMESALTSTFALAQTVSSDVLLVTDGEISAIDDTITAAQHSGHRVFVVGIGSSPAETHLRRLAEATGGGCDFVAPGEAVEPAVLRMFARLRSPRLDGVRLVWPDGVQPLWVSPVLPSVFDGDTVNVFALLPHTATGEVHLVGQPAGNGRAPTINQTIGRATLPTPAQQQANAAVSDTLSKLVATARHQTQDTAHDRAEIAVAYGLVTDETNFLLVHQRAEQDKATDMPTLHTVDQMMPVGWSGQSNADSPLLDVLEDCEMPWSDTGSPAFPVAEALPSPQSVAPPAPMKRSAVVQRSQLSFSRSNFSIDDLDADPPAFLRQAPSPATQPRHPPYWADTPHYTGLTPLGLSDYLQTTNRQQWPTCYQEMQQIGVGVWVVDWLELVIATHAGATHDEASVVAAFLHLMSQSSVHQVLSSHNKQSIGDALNAAVRPTKGIDMQVLHALATVLTSMSATAWPAEVFALEG